MPEQEKQIVRNDADTEEGGIGFELSAGHAFHAEADLQRLDPIFRDLATLAIPN